MTTLIPAQPSQPRRPARRARVLPNRVSLLEVLPDVADRLPPEYARSAAQIGARVLSVRRGAWDGPGDLSATGCYGFVVLTGTVLRLTQAGHRQGAELLGTGDLVQPQVDADVTWRAVEETTLVALEPRLMAEASRVPAIAGALLAAATSRANVVARQLVIAQWSSVDERIVAVLEMLAERWGVVTPDGVVLPEWLTHSIIAPLVGARRPSVTTALKRLDATGAVVRQHDGRWLLGQPA